MNSIPFSLTRFRSGLRIALAAYTISIFGSLPGAGEPALPDSSSPVATLNQVSTVPESGRVVELNVSSIPTDAELSGFQGMSEPLRPIIGNTPENERIALGHALNTWSARSSAEDMSALQGFISAFPNSPWVPSLYLNLGRFRYSTGYFSKAMDEWLLAWNLSKDCENDDGVAIANAAVAEYAVMLARVGRKEELSTLLGSVSTRTFQSGSHTLLERAREGLWNMENRPGISFRCGPYALSAILTAQSGEIPTGFMKSVVSPPQGFSLTELKQMASEELSTEMQVAKRSAGATVIVPSLVHWKVGHYGALTKEQDGAILLRDTTFGNDTWMSRAAVDEEASGYFLVPAGSLPAGWEAVPDTEASTIYGKGHSGNADGDETGKCSDKSGNSCDNPHMAGYSFHTLLASLNITDIPIGYTPAYGPAVNFEVVYNMKEARLPIIASDFTNTSPLWLCNWVAYLVDNTDLPAADIKIYTRGGGAETHSGYNSVTAKFSKNNRSDTILVKTSGNSYERQFPDGSKEVYAQAIGDTGTSRKVFLTKVVDPQGQAVTLQYGTSAGMTSRIEKIIDARGLVTQLEYTEPGSNFLVTKVIDPFTREATFSYASIYGAKRLQTIKDTMGIESSFEYNKNGQITALVTPYGRTTFTFESPNTAYGLIRWIEATDPLGGKERLEYHVGKDVTNVPSSLLATDVPQLPLPYYFTNADLDDRNSFYWSKKAWAMAPGDYSKAHLKHWVNHTESSDRAVGVLESEKKPFESRVWYRYPGQQDADSSKIGTSSQPEYVARIVENESATGGRSTQKTKFTYNTLGNILSCVDPLGRESAVEYESNGIDPKAVKQKIGGVFRIIQSFAYATTGYPAHRPQSTTDAAGKTSTFTYENATGQLKTVTNALGETTTINYGTSTGLYENDSTDYYPKGLPYEVIGPVPGARLTISYDSCHRPRFVRDWSDCTTANPIPYTVKYDYDDFDRTTLITYPDGTTEKFEYGWVDPASPSVKKAPLDLYARKDRQGRWSRTWHNALRQPVLTADALGQTLQFEWCKCGSLQKLIDGKGQLTSWKYDAQGRFYQKTFADNRTVSIGYEPLSGRVTTETDSAAQVKTYKYNTDGTLKSVSYSALASGTAPTSGVSYTYDPDVFRPVSMTDGTGITSIQYHPALRTVESPATVQLGAMQINTVNGPITGSSDLITYGYDELGRLKTKNIGAVGSENLTTYSYDNLSRISGVINSLGAFGYSYVEHTERIREIVYPAANGQITTFDYYPSADSTTGNGDKRLKTIMNTRPIAGGGMEALSKFDYTYLKDGNIATWQRQFGPDTSTATLLTLGYDSVDQLTTATLALVNSPHTLSERYSYQYDKAGNRMSQQRGNKVNKAASNSVNQITALTGGGKFLVTGYTDEPAKVKVNGQPATTTPTTSDPLSKDLYQAWVELEPGSRIITVEAEDYVTPPNKNPPVTTPSTQPKQWSVNVTGDPSRSFTYDGNGNVLSDGVRSYVWDAENRLVKITKGTASYEFAYDGLSRRIRSTERNSFNVVISDKRYLWTGGGQPAEERDALGTTVLKQYHAEGEFVPAAAAPLNRLFYSRDHLGSIREVTDGNAAIRVRYDYDPYGKRAEIPIGVDDLGEPVYGDVNCDFGFTGHYYHAGAELHLTLYRAYDQNTGRWLSPDPLGEKGGINLYAYVGGNPINSFDPYGLCEAALAGGGMEISKTMIKLAAGAALSDTPAPGPGDVIGAVLVVGAGAVAVVEYYGDFNYDNSPTLDPTRIRPPLDGTRPVISPPLIRDAQATPEDIANFAKKSKSSGKERASDVPDWAKYCTRDPALSTHEQTKAWLREKYGEGTSRAEQDGGGSEYSKIKKWLERIHN